MAQLSKNMEKLSVTKGKNRDAMRKRLSLTKGQMDTSFLDGKNAEIASKHNAANASSSSMSSDEHSDMLSKSQLFKSYSMRTKVGFVPFNNAKVNQDRAIMMPSISSASKPTALFGVLDGHGMYGHVVSEYLMKITPEWFLSHKNWNKDPNDALKRCFESLTKSLKRSKINCTFSGTTAVMTVMNETHLITANCGDSRAVLAREDQNGKLTAIALSIDQKPDDEHEKARIEKNDGRVEPCKGPMGEHLGPARVWLAHQDLPGLAMSRSFGDDVAAQVGVISVPQIITTARSKKDQFMVTASDGIWEFMDNQQVVDFVSKYKDPRRAAKALCAEATRKWKEEEDVIDDITAVVIYF